MEGGGFGSGWGLVDITCLEPSHHRGKRGGALTEWAYFYPESGYIPGVQWGKRRGRRPLRGQSNWAGKNLL